MLLDQLGRAEAQGRVAGRISLALDTRWWSAKETRVRSGWLHGRIYWMTLV